MCRELDLSGGQCRLPTTGPGPILQGPAYCTGNEATILDCPFASNYHNCGHSFDNTMPVRCGDIDIIFFFVLFVGDHFARYFQHYTTRTSHTRRATWVS